MAPAVSVIIPAFRARRTLPLQLECLAHQVDAPEFEVLVCDNEPDPETRRLVERTPAEGFSLRYVDASRVRGAAFARNVGARLARADKLAFCDADDVVSAHWVAAADRALDRFPIVSGASCHLTESEFGQKGGRGPLWAFLDSECPGGEPFPAKKGTVAPVLMGGCFAARKDFFVALGGMDTSLARGAEDNDLAYRVQESGTVLMEDPDLAIIYRIPDDPGTLVRKFDTIGHSMALLCARHDLWDTAEPYRSHPALQLVRTGLSAGLMAVGRKEKDWMSIGRRGATNWGLLRGLVQYRVLGRIPASGLGQGLDEPAPPAAR